MTPTSEGKLGRRRKLANWGPSTAPTCCLLPLLFAPLLCHAVEKDSAGIAIGLRGGTLGVGPEVSAPLATWCTVRLLGHGGMITVDRKVSGIEYGADLKFANMGAIVDFHAPHSHIHLSLGAFYNGNEWTGRATPERPIRIGGVRFHPYEVGTLRADLDTATAVAYAGIGFGNPVAPNTRWCVSMDLGVWWFPSRPTARLGADGPLATFEVFQAALGREEREINEELVQWWPVLSLGISYRF